MSLFHIIKIKTKIDWLRLLSLCKIEKNQQIHSIVVRTYICPFIPSNYSRLEKLYFLYLIYRGPGHRVSQCPLWSNIRFLLRRGYKFISIHFSSIFNKRIFKLVFVYILFVTYLFYTICNFRQKIENNILPNLQEPNSILVLMSLLLLQNAIMQLHKDYISLSWSNIPYLGVPTCISLREDCC